jgi:hypothetical protein
MTPPCTGTKIWSNAATAGNVVPPRDPDDYKDEDENEEDEDRNEDLDPAVIREPDG